VCTWAFVAVGLVRDKSLGQWNPSVKRPKSCFAWLSWFKVQGGHLSSFISICVATISQLFIASLPAQPTRQDHIVPTIKRKVYATEKVSAAYHRKGLFFGVGGGVREETATWRDLTTRQIAVFKSVKWPVVLSERPIARTGRSVRRSPPSLFNSQSNKNQIEKKVEGGRWSFMIFSSSQFGNSKNRTKEAVFYFV
jgi:hypothetical protein